MKKEEKVHSSKKYLTRIIMLTTGAASLVILILSVAVFLNAQNILMQKEYDANKKIFRQVKINIDMMDTMANNLCKYLYLNNDVGSIMYAEEENPINWITKINNMIGTVTSANPYIYSIFIYNGKLGQFYNAGQPNFSDDRLLMDFIAGKVNLPKVKAVSRKMEKLINLKTEYDDVFSYFMYDKAENSTEVEGAISLNVKTNWFVDNIRQINLIDRSRGDKVFVINDKNDFIYTGEESGQMEEWISNEFIKHKPYTLSDGSVDFFQSSFQEEDYLVSYIYISSMSISIIKAQRITEVYGAISKLKIGVVTITLILLVMAVLLFILVSNRIYKPIGKLVKLISSDKNNTPGDHGKHDEIVYLNDFYRSSMEKLELYHREKYRNKDITKHYWLNLLLLESHKLDVQQIGHIFEQEKICLLADQGFIVSVIKIDHYRFFMQEQSAKERELLRFAIANIASEIIDKQYKNECIDMKEDHLAIIISVPESDENYEQNIRALFNEAQEFIYNYFRLTVSVSVSKKTMDIKELSLLYGRAINNMAYRLILGHSCVISQEYFQKNENRSGSITLNEEEALINEKIKAGDFEDIEAVLKKAFQKISNMHYDHILVSLINLARLINNTLESQKTFQTMNIHFDFNYICQSIMEKETLEEIYDIFVERLGSIQDNDELPAQSKNSYIISAVKDYIYKNYDNKSLSLTSISEFINISPRRLSRIFKEEMQMAVADYITDVRLDKAAELLEHAALNVNEVIARLGIKNDTYFFVLFKKKFGLTPKEYSFKRIVKMSQE